jgi:acetyl esterase/lipase
MTVSSCFEGEGIACRNRASAVHIDPQRVGVLGFSAGAHLAAALSPHFDHRLYDPIDAADQLSCRPDFAVIVYPGYFALAGQNFAPNPDIPVTGKTPPSFIVQAEDDPVHVENAVVYYLALKNAKVPDVDRDENEEGTASRTPYNPGGKRRD